MTTEITDDYMRDIQTNTMTYTFVLLKRTARAAEPGAMAVIWEHGRRNHALRAAGILPIVCPTPGDSELAGVGIFDAEPDEAARIMDQDPAVQAGLFTYTLHGCHGFPGDSLPGEGRSWKDEPGGSA